MNPSRHTIVALCLTIGTSLASLPATAQKFYQWVDENGVTHFTQTPPKGHVESEEILVELKASSDQQSELKARDARHQAEADARRKAQEAAERAAQNRPPPPPKRSEAECAQLRANLEVLNRDSMVRSRDPETGEEKLLDTEARQSAIKDAQERLTNC